MSLSTDKKKQLVKLQAVLKEEQADYDRYRKQAQKFREGVEKEQAAAAQAKARGWNQQVEEHEQLAADLRGQYKRWAERAGTAQDRIVALREGIARLKGSGATDVAEGPRPDPEKEQAAGRRRAAAIQVDKINAALAKTRNEQARASQAVEQYTEQLRVAKRRQRSSKGSPESVQASSDAKRIQAVLDEEREKLKAAQKRIVKLEAALSEQKKLAEG